METAVVEASRMSGRWKESNLSRHLICLEIQNYRESGLLRQSTGISIDTQQY